MKVLIEIDEGLIDSLKNGSFGIRYNTYDLCGAVANGVPLNGTNGEVFGKIMGSMFMDGAYITTDRRGYLHLRGVKDDWWNADYKGVE